MTPFAPAQPFHALIEEMTAQGETEYRTLVFRLVDGESIDPSELREVLQASSRTRADLERHYKAVLARRKAVADLEQAAELDTALVDFQAAQQQAADRVRQQEEANQQALQPLLDDLDKAADKSQRTQREARTLRAEATAVLQKTMSPAMREQFDNLSDRACRLAQRIATANQQAARLVRETGEAEQEVERCQSELKHLIGKPNREPAQASIEKSLADAQQQLANLRYAASEVEQLRQQHSEAAGALEQFEQTDFHDWRNIAFD
ncbi:MAG: hypothetical protein KDA57_23140 [Planctomycetales bacterium]|nr:hypothetical protein [Planctomycetales bacterium]